MSRQPTLASGSCLLTSLILVVLPVPGHCLGDALVEADARLVAQLRLGLLDAEVEVQPEELEPALREHRRLARPLLAGALFHPLGKNARQPERRPEGRRLGELEALHDRLDE